MYNQDKVKDLSTVICPPYDVLSPAEQRACYNRSPYNMSRLLLKNDRRCVDYSHSRKNLIDWIDRDVLYRDRQKAIYFYEQEYTCPANHFLGPGKTNKRYSVRACLGEKKKREGFISLLKIEDNNGLVHAHEHTHLAPKEDRLELLQQVEANLSPIFVLFADKKRVIRRLADKYASCSPVIDIKEPAGRHRLWRIDDAVVIDMVRAGVKPVHLFIADGHHRYEVACNFRRQMHKTVGNGRRELSCDYVMTYFTDVGSRGLTILPTHRVIRRVKAAGLREKLGRYFDIYKAKDGAELFIMLGRAGRNECVLGMYGKKDGFLLLRLRSDINIDDFITLDKPREYKRLSTVVLDWLVLGDVFGLDPERPDEKNVFYTNAAARALEMVDEGQADVSFFVNPVRMEDLMQLALQGERLPPKTTFFFPKLPSGLTIYKF